MKYPILAIHQPWAQLIRDNIKVVETRTHNRFKSLLHRTILISATSKWDKDFLNKAIHLPDDYDISKVEDKGGLILCSAFVKNIGRCSHKDERATKIECKTVIRYGLFLSNIRKISPIPFKNGQGIRYLNVDNLIYGR